MNSKWHWPTASRITDISWQIVPGYLQINLTRTLWGVMIRSNCKNVTTRRNDLQPRRAPLGAKEYKTNCGNKQDTWPTHGLKKILSRVFLHPGVFFVCLLGIFYLWEDRKRQYSGLVFQNNQFQTYIKLKLITSTRLVSSSCPSLLREGAVDFQLVPCRLQFSWKVKRQISKYFCECIHKTCLSETMTNKLWWCFVLNGQGITLTYLHVWLELSRFLSRNKMNEKITTTTQSWR